MPENALANYLKGRTPGLFVPRPHYFRDGNFIEWYWKDEDCYCEPVHVEVDGERVWVGSVMKSMATDEVVGVKIMGEQVGLDRETAEMLNVYRESLARLAKTDGETIQCP